jgi:hypothetical protein
MKNRLLHFITAALKIVSTALILAPALGYDNNNAALGGLIFVSVSALKDLLIGAGDWLDDGKRNNSFKGLPLIAVCALCLSLTACENLSPALRASLEKSAAAALEAGTARVVQEIGPRPVRTQPQK